MTRPTRQKIVIYSSRKNWTGKKIVSHPFIETVSAPHIIFFAWAFMGPASGGSGKMRVIDLVLVNREFPTSSALIKISLMMEIRMIRWRPNASDRPFNLTCYQHKDNLNQMDRVVLEHFHLISVTDVPCAASSARKYALEYFGCCCCYRWCCCCRCWPEMF